MSGIKPSLDCHAPKRKKKLLVLTIMLISISKSPKTAYLSEHYSFKDKIFSLKKGHSYQ